MKIAGSGNRTGISAPLDFVFACIIDLIAYFFNPDDHGNHQDIDRMRSFFCPALSFACAILNQGTFP